MKKSTVSFGFYKREKGGKKKKKKGNPMNYINELQ